MTYYPNSMKPKMPQNSDVRLVRFLPNSRSYMCTIVVSFQAKRWLFICLALALLASGCKKQSFGSGSMAPTIAVGEKVTINYFAYAVSSPKRWEVVAFNPPGETNQIWLMRVIECPVKRWGLPQ